MQIELKDIKGGVLKQEYTCSRDEFPELGILAEQGDVEFVDPLGFRLRLQRTGQLVEVEGQLTAVVQLKCGRCLKPFTQSLDESFALTFAPRSETDVSDEEEIELEADELGLILYDDETLELFAPLQEQLLMAVPIAPVCDDSCQGLCHECGQNLNDGTCSCERKPFNNKFSALAGIKFKE